MKLLRVKTGRIVVAIYLWLFLDIIVSAHRERERERKTRYAYLGWEVSLLLCRDRLYMNGGYFATCVCVCVCVCAWKRKKKEKRKRDLLIYFKNRYNMWIGIMYTAFTLHKVITTVRSSNGIWIAC